MSLDGVKTYWLLDKWADAPDKEGLNYVMALLKGKGESPSREAVHHRIWLGLVDLDLLDANKKSSPRDWKLAKLAYRRLYRHRIT